MAKHAVCRLYVQAHLLLKVINTSHLVLPFGITISTVDLGKTMKTLSALFSIGALSFAASSMADVPATQLPSGESLSLARKETDHELLQESRG